MLFPIFKSKSKRTQTFKDPHLAKIWAQSGFFQKTISNYVCFYCGVEKLMLPVNCCPWKSHYLWNPFCDYVRICKGIPQVQTIDCLVCFEKERNTVTFPCRHMVLCDVCAKELKNCIVCRQEVVNYFQVFLN
jgi:hypothetical protein